MSVDTTFKPITPSVSFTTSAVQVVTDKANPGGITTFRVTNTGSGGIRFSWGGASVASPTGAGPNTMYVGAGLSVYIEVPVNSYFIGASGATFDVIGGIGGTGG